jgi:hypothetical protein
MKRLITCLMLAATLTSCDESLVGSKKVLYARSQSFESNPTGARLRELLNSRTDGAMSYLKMALVGEAFGNHPEQFKLIVNDLKTREERESYQWLREWGSGVFEYYPERKPEGFDKVHSAAKWLKPTKAGGGADQPAAVVDSKQEGDADPTPESEVHPQ